MFIVSYIVANAVAYDDVYAVAYAFANAVSYAIANAITNAAAYKFLTVVQFYSAFSSSWTECLLVLVDIY